MGQLNRPRPASRRVPSRMIPGKSRAAMAGRHVLRLDQVLDAYRHTVDGRDRAPSAIPLGRGVGRLARARRVEDDPGFHDRFAIVDYRKTALEIGPRRVAPVAKPRHHIKKGQWVKTFWRVGHSIFLSSAFADSDQRRSLA